MTDVPPKEGARWGEDPQEVVLPQAASATDYDRLCREFSPANVDRALAIRRKLYIDYPHLDLWREDPNLVASKILETARRSMETASEDGRTHSMPETLNIVEKYLGPALSQQGQTATLEKLTLTYGDERQGKAHKQKYNEDTVKWVSAGASIAGALALNSGLMAAVGWALMAGLIVLIFRSL